MRDNSDLCDWNIAKASSHFDFWAENLHGSEIMPLLLFEISQDHMVSCISKLMFDQESHGTLGWLTRRHHDYYAEQRRLAVVHLLNDAMGYSCTCHQVHVYPNGSQDQDIHVRYALELLRVCGQFGDAYSMLVAVLSCFGGRCCLNSLEEFGIFLDRSECDLLTQVCQDKRVVF